MEYRLGKSFFLPATDPNAPAEPPVEGRLYVDETIEGIDGSVLKLTLPATAPETHRQLVEIRAYLVPHDQSPPDTAEDYLSSDCQYAVVDVTAFAGPGGLVEIQLPEVDRVVPYFGQLVHGYAD